MEKSLFSLSHVENLSLRTGTLAGSGLASFFYKLLWSMKLFGVLVELRNVLGECL